MKLNAKLLSVVLNTKTLKMIQCYTNVYVAIRITKKYDENLKRDLLICLSFLTMISMSLFCYF